MRAIDGIEEARNKISVWLQKRLPVPGAEVEEDVNVEILLQGSAHDPSNHIEIDQLSFTPGDNIEAFVDQIIDTCERETQSQRIKTKYAIRIEHNTQRCTFTLTPVSEDGEDDEDAFDHGELPNRRGLIGQQMKHNEVFAKLLVAASQSDRETTDRRMRNLENQNNYLMKAHFDNMRLVEELHSMSFAREMEAAKFKNEEARREKIMNTLQGIAPVIASRLLGPGAAQPVAQSMGVQSTPVEQMVANLIQSFKKDDEKLSRLLQVLEPQDVAQFMEILNAVEGHAQPETHVQVPAPTPQPPPQPVQVIVQPSAPKKPQSFFAHFPYSHTK